MVAIPVVVILLVLLCVGGCIWRCRTTSRAQRKAELAAAAVAAQQQQLVADLQRQLQQLQQQHQPVDPPVYQEQEVEAAAAAAAAAVLPQEQQGPPLVPQPGVQRQHRRGEGTESERRGLLSSTRHHLQRAVVVGGPLAEATGTAIRRSGRKLSRKVSKGATAVTNYGRQVGQFLVLSPEAREAHLEAAARQEGMETQPRSWRHQQDHRVEMGFANINYDPAGVDNISLPPPPSPWNYRSRPPPTPPPPPPPPPPFTPEEVDAIRNRRLAQHFRTRAEIQLGGQQQQQQHQQQHQTADRPVVDAGLGSVAAAAAAAADGVASGASNDDDNSTANRGTRRKIGMVEELLPLRRMDSPESSDGEH
jgi:hypothetical protein